MRLFLFVIALFLPGVAAAQSIDAPPPAAASALAGAAHASVAVVACTGDAGTDSAALATALSNAAAAGSGTLIQVHGQCRVETALGARLSTSVAVAGDGVGITTLTFTNATDGFDFTLLHTRAGWGSASLGGMTIIRGPTSPAQANTAISITADPGAGVGHDVITADSNLSIVGSSAGTSAWRDGIVLSGVSQVTLNGVAVTGPNNAGTDNGDIGISYSGPSSAMYAVDLSLNSVFVTGFSCGLCIDGYVQGVNLGSTTSIIGNYDSVRWYGIRQTPATLSTSSTTTAGDALQFTPGTLGGIDTTMFLNGTGIPTDAHVSSVDNGTGRVTISPAIAGAVTRGTAVAFQPSFSAEALTVTNSTFGAQHADISCLFCALGTISNSSFLRFGSAAAAWTGIDCYECNNMMVIGNGFIGALSGVNTAISFVAPNPTIGETPNAIIGNTVSRITGGPCIGLRGATSNTVVLGNSCQGTFGGGVTQVARTNMLLGNKVNGAFDAATFPAGAAAPAGGEPAPLKIGSLPPCGTSNRGQKYVVSDAVNPTFRRALTGSGTPSAAGTVTALCNGASWVAD